MKTYYVYIMTNPKRTVLYTGFTSNLMARVEAHKSKSVKGFAARYNCTLLVYFEETDSSQTAFAREKGIKGWKCCKKDDLIRKVNPQLRDLSLDW